MPLRKHYIQEKRKPGLPFILPIDITFSLSVDYNTEYEFGKTVSNNNDDVSKVLRTFVFTKLNVKNKKEFEDLMYDIIKEAKQLIYKKIGVNKDNSFSNIMIKDINKYNKKYAI